MVGKDGQSLRKTLEEVKKQTGKAPKELINPVEFPIILRDEWEYFLKLNASRTAGMSSDNPISEQEIHYFFRNRKIDVQSWQIDLIRRLDVVALNVEK